MVRHGVSSQGLFEIGRYLQAQERYHEAAIAYRECVVSAPGHIEAHNALGVVLALRGHYEAAYASFARALALSPTAPYLWNNLGYAYFLAGEKPAAEAALTYGQSLAPSAPKIRELLARVQGDFRSEASAHGPAVGLPGVGMAGNETRPTPEETTHGDGRAATAVARGIETSWQVIQSPPLQLLPEGPSEYALQAPVPRSTGGQDGTDLSTGLTLEISNGNGIRGMAQQLSQTLAERGLPTVRLTNTKGFAVRKTELHYRVGHEVAAANLLAVLPSGIRLRQANDMRSDITIRLVLGKDITKTSLSRNAPSLAGKSSERIESGKAS